MGFKKRHKCFEGCKKSWFKKGSVPWNKGIPMSEEAKRKLSRLKTKYPKKICPICKQEFQSYFKNQQTCSSKCKGKKMSLDRKGNWIIKISTKEKISSTLKKKYINNEIKTNKGRKYSKEKYPNFGMRNKLFSDEHRLKISISHIGKKVSIETKKKMSQSAIKHMIKVGRTYLTPNIGIQEKNILDSLEKELHIKIIRQFRIGKYFVDGYCKHKNTVFEIDEEYHHKHKKQYDEQREVFIRKKLNCEFIRICV